VKQVLKGPLVYLEEQETPVPSAQQATQVTPVALVSPVAQGQPAKQACKVMLVHKVFWV
jgi:hypothetical protein